MAWKSPSEPKSSHLLLIYCFLATLFCFRFIHLAHEHAQACTATIQTATQNISYDIAFPRKIWQTSKTNVASLEEGDRSRIQTWLKLNQKHRYELITRYSAESYIKEKFNHRPDIQEIFQDLQDPILRADFIRYLVLLGDGGVYSDIDTMCLVPVEDWVPQSYRGKANLVVGVEYDSLGHGRWADWTLDLQLATWATLSKPGHLALEITVNSMIQRINRLAQNQGTTIAGIRSSFNDVLETTGPAMFTEAVFESLSFTTGDRFTWHNVSGLTSPWLVSDILILPVNAFGSGQQHSNSGSPDGEMALVRHLFKGSWKDDRPREESETAKKDKEGIKPEEEEKRQDEKRKEEERKREEDKKKKEEEKKRQDEKKQQEEEKKDKKGEDKQKEMAR